MKSCWIWHCCRTEHQLTRTQKLKVGSETIFLNSKSKTNDPQTCLTYDPKKICEEFSKPGWKCQNLTPGILNIFRPLWKPARNWLALKPWKTWSNPFHTKSNLSLRPRNTFPWNKICPTLLDLVMDHYARFHYFWDTLYKSKNKLIQSKKIRTRTLVEILRKKGQ